MTGSWVLHGTAEAREVPAVHDWPSNAHLIEDVARLGYLRDDDVILDATYGLGVFWQRWKPAAGRIVANDLDRSKGTVHDDFRDLAYMDRYFDAVVFDPPYKLNGTPDATPGGVDHRFGVHDYTRWQDRMTLILDGVRECARVCSRTLLVKCQDQVVSGKMVWQTDEITKVAVGCGFRKRDRFDLIGKARPQPAGRSQNHARGRGSTLLVFERTTTAHHTPAPVGDRSTQGDGEIEEPGHELGALRTTDRTTDDD